jgi:hypothetical protein
MLQQPMKVSLIAVICLYSFSHRDINTCDLDGTGVCIQTYIIDVNIGMCVKMYEYNI